MGTKMGTTKLTAAQWRMLQRLAGCNGECVPGGRPDSGREASNWYRTLDVLKRHGLAERALYGRAYITEAGRAFISEGSK